MDFNNPQKMFYNTVKFQREVEKMAADVRKRLKDPFPDIEDPPPLPRGYSPDKTLLTEVQGQMNVVWGLYGVGGLPKYVADLTRAHANRQGISGGEGDPHRHILDDWNNKKYGSGALLMSMHPQLVEAIINGDVPFWVENDVQFRLMKSRYCRLLPYPGIYLNAIARLPFHKATGEQQQYPGCGLSWHQLKEDFYNLRETDKTFPTHGAKEKNQTDYAAGFRRYRPSKHAEIVILEFLKQVKEIWLKEGQELFDRDPDDPLLDIPMRRCFQEVGWGADVHGRAADHPTHIATNYLLGLFHATVTRFNPGVFKMFQYQVLRVTTPDHASLSEYLISQVASSYWYEAGLNTELAGRCPFKPHHYDFFVKNTEDVYSSKLYLVNEKFHKELIAHSNKLLEWWETFDPKAEQALWEKGRERILRFWEKLLEETDDTMCRWTLEWQNKLRADDAAEQGSIKNEDESS